MNIEYLKLEELRLDEFHLSKWDYERMNKRIVDLRGFGQFYKDIGKFKHAESLFVRARGLERLLELYSCFKLLDS